MRLRLALRDDTWTTPPGGLPDGARSSNLRSWIAYVVVVSLLLGGGMTYASMRASTPVSAEDALAEFQATRSQSSSPDAAGPTRTAGDRGQKRPDRSRPRLGADGTDARATLAASGGSSTDDPSRSSDQAGDARAAGQQPPNEDDAPGVSRPAEGVYTWNVEGYEQAPGVRRQLPPRSHRVITHEGEDAWQEHHIFSEEREQWIDLTASDEGVATTSVRNRVKMGPVEQDRTVVYNPPVFVARFPTTLGRTWKGSWTGRTSGTYTAKVFEHTTIVIEGERVEVIATEVVMHMRGELEGRATTRSWWSPKYQMVVKQGQDMQIESGPTDYRSEWIGQVQSVRPQT